MLKPEVKKVEGAEMNVKGANAGMNVNVKLFGDKVSIVDSFGVFSKSIDVRDLIMASESLKLAFKNLSFCCGKIGHGFFGAPKGRKQIPTCPSCLAEDRLKIHDEGDEDNEG